MNGYDQILIDRYDERKIKNWILKNRKLEKIYANKKKYYEYKGELNANYIAMGDAIDSWMAKYISSTPKNKLDKHIVDNYWRNAYSEVITERERIFSNPVFTLDDSFLQPVFGKEGGEAINKRQKVLSKRAREIYHKYSNMEGITTEERNELIDFLTHTIGANEGIRSTGKNVVNDIVNLGDNATLKEKAFVYKFLANEYCKREKINAKVYLSDYRIDEKRKIKTDELGIQDKDIVILNKYYVNKLDFGKTKDQVIQRENPKKRTLEKIGCATAISSLYHELIHVKQCDKATKGYIDTQEYYAMQMLLEEKLQKRKFKKHYLTNYNYTELELDANVESFKETQKFFEKYAPDRIEEVKSHLTKAEMIEELNNATGVKYDLKKEKLMPDEFNVSVLDEMMRKKHKKAFKEFPQLSLYYDRNGNSKSLEKLLMERERNINEKNDEHHDYTNVYYEQINAKIDKGDLTFIDLYNKTDKERKLISSSLLDTMADSIRQITNLYRNTQFNKDARENYDFITAYRFERIDKIYSVFSLNKELFQGYNMEKAQRYKDMSDMYKKEVEEPVKKEEKVGEGFEKRLF